MIRWERIVLAAMTCCLSAATTPSIAEQPQAVTISTDENPIFIGGKLQGCDISFEVGRNDPEYSGGGAAYLSGSLSLFAFEGGSTYFVLKLATKGTGAADFQAPAQGYLVDGNSTNVADFYESQNGVSAGSKLFLFRPGPVTLRAAWDDVVKNRTLTIGYAMQPGGMTSVVPIDLQVRQLNFDSPGKSRVDDQLVGDWIKCSKMLITAADNTDGGK